MGNNLAPHVENARKTGVCSLAGKRLNEVPPQVFHLGASLRTLDLSQNKLKTLPASIGELTGLKNLTLTSNRLETLPSDMCKLKKLETLTANHSSIKHIPSGLFSGLKNLKTLSLASNQLSVFPEELCTLQHLDVVDLSDNKIKIIPENIGDLQAVELNLNKNQISTLPQSLAFCPRMKVFRAEENCLQLDQVPIQLLTESNISLLAFDGNLFTMKDFRDKDGYEKYMERYTATKKKFA